MAAKQRTFWIAFVLFAGALVLVPFGASHLGSHHTVTEGRFELPLGENEKSVVTWSADSLREHYEPPPYMLFTPPWEGSERLRGGGTRVTYSARRWERGVGGGWMASGVPVLGECAIESGRGYHAGNLDVENTIREKLAAAGTAGKGGGQ
jgi:hypothetical protein